MANLARVRTVWSGSAVTGGGVSTFYFDEAGSGWVASLNTFWTAVKPFCPTGITWTTQGSGDLINVETGELSGSWTDGGTSVVNTVGGNNWAAGAGARIKWRTSGLVGGRRVAGSTFICPVMIDNYDLSGQIKASTVITLSAAAQALVTASTHELNIYSRKVEGSVDPADDRAGEASPAISGECPPYVSWLRSRRT